MGRRKQAETHVAMVGHNSALNADDKLRLSGFISEIERWEAEKKIISTDISEIYKSAKDKGFDTAAMRHTIKLRKMEREKRDAFEAACDAYAHALGDFATTPLAQAMAPKQDAAHA